MGAISLGGVFTALAARNTGGQSQGNGLRLQPGYRIVNSTGQYAVSGTYNQEAHPWAAAIVSYKIETPRVLSITLADPSPVANAATVHFAVSFSDNVFGVDAGDFALAES